MTDKIDGGAVKPDIQELKRLADRLQQDADMFGTPEYEIPLSHWQNALADMATASSTILALIEIAEAAKIVMDLLEEHGPSIVPHLLDTDENAGQRLRTALEGVKK